MQALPSNWEAIRNGIHRVETKVTISGVEYSEEETLSLSTSSALFSKGTASIGGCVAKQIDLLVKPKGDIPRMAEIRPYIRLAADKYVASAVAFMKPLADTCSVVTPDGRTYYFTLDYWASIEYGSLIHYATLWWSASEGLTGVVGGAYKVDAAGTQETWEVDITFTQTAPSYEVTNFATLKTWGNNGTEYTDWLPKGVFYIDTRRKDTVMGTLTIHGYDAMMKAETEFLQEGDTGEWPRASSVIVGQICELMGLVDADGNPLIDERTQLNDEIKVPYPNDWTCREILSFIAVAHCGNWVITDVGKLRLVPFGVLPEETNYLVDEHGDAITFGGVRIIV